MFTVSEIKKTKGRLVTGIFVLEKDLFFIPLHLVTWKGVKITLLYWFEHCVKVCLS